MLKDQSDLDTGQIDAPAPVTADSITDEAADELTSPDASRECTPDGSFSAPASLGRHSTSRTAPACGHWNQAPSALSGNLGRLRICLELYISTVADMRQPQAAVQ